MNETKGLYKLDLFWAKIALREPGRCWMWTGAKRRRGYGAIKRDRRVISAHRLAWASVHGDIPAGMHILHTCDKPGCCNPAHLRVGTPAENMQDMHRKGRSRWAGRS